MKSLSPNSGAIVNLSTVFASVARDDRPRAAADAGFHRVESWWEFNSATPDPEDMQSFLYGLSSAGVELTAINSHGGDRAAGERGLACLPDRVEEFRASIESICEVAQVTAARRFNVTFGCLQPDKWDVEEQLATAEKNYRWAAERVVGFGGALLIEALVAEGNGGYPMHSGEQVVSFLTNHLKDVNNVRFLFDTFHLAANGQDLITTWSTTHHWVGHVQFADYPGRGAPGTGDINFAALKQRMVDDQYAGDIALEYLG